MHSNKFLAFAAAAMTLLALAACKPVTPEGTVSASQAGQASSSLAGTSWVATEVGGQPLVQDTTVTLQFGADGRATGSDGCNRYSTGYRVSGDSITFSPAGAATLMACPEPIMQQAKAYQEALAATAAYQVENGALTLLDAGGVTVAAFAAQSTDLAGTSWNVISYNNGKQAVVSTLADVSLTANFGADGRVSGKAGCNNYTGAYTLSGKDGIQIGPLATTRKLCAEPAGVMEQEQQFVTAMSTAATFRMEADRLELRTADGALAVQFQRAQEAAVPAKQDAASAAAGAAATMSATVSGTVTYLVRMALPPDANVDVSINNAQLADAPPEMTLLATISFPTEGKQVPIPYVLPYDPTKVQEGALYSIRARITDATGRLLFTSTTAIPVITQGNPTENVEILVQPVQQ